MADDQTPSASGSDQITEPQIPDFDAGDGRVPGQAYVRVDTSAAAGVASTLSNIPVYGQSAAQAGAASVITTTGISDLDAALQSIGTQAVWRLAADDDTAPAVAAADTTGDSGTGADAAGATSTSLAGVLLVEFNQANNLDQALQTLSGVSSVAEAHPVGWFTIAMTVDDPSFPAQWGLPDLHVPDVWDTTTGSSSVTVAVVDTGCDYNHTDLKPQLLTGASFIPGVATAQDDHGHGTHVAGIVAATGNNTQDIAGIAWGCRILPVKVLASGGFASGASIAAGIFYAASRCQVMNCSIQGRVDDFATRIAVGVAVVRGTLVVAAMGNAGWTETTPSYPAAYPGVFAVGAIDSNHHRSVWSATQSSNQGSWIDVAAPGTNIVSLRLTGGVTTMSGTSQASPHVAGVLALLLSSPPTASGISATDAITSSCSALQDNATDPVPNSAYGHGLVDAKAALDKIHPPVGDFPTPSTDTAVADASNSQQNTDSSTSSTDSTATPSSTDSTVADASDSQQSSDSSSTSTSTSTDSSDSTDSTVADASDSQQSSDSSTTSTGADDSTTDATNSVSTT